MAAVLWPHQEDAAGKAAALLADGGRCQVIAACGTGKTVIGAEVSRRVAPAGRVLVVVPTLELLAQTARAYAGYLGSGAGLIAAVCSEGAATAEAAEIRQEMAHLHAGVSTAPADVTRWMSRPGRITILTTYQSLTVIAAARKDGAPPWDLAVIDEAHRSAGRTDRAWHAVHDDTAIPAARRLYMTATPRVMSSERYETVSMDDPAVFGPEAFRLPFADAISAGLLADYRVAVTVVTRSEVADMAAGHRVVSAGGPAVPAQMLAAQVAVLKACARWDLRRVITFHHRVAAARRFAGSLANAAGLLPDDLRPAVLRADSVDGTMPLWQRRDILRHLRDPGRRTVVVSNARVLGEGVDVPELDAVMFADPRDSVTDVVQAVGRALRRGESAGKVATIIIPVLLADGETPEAALEGSAWDAVWRVVRALRAHDERLADWLDERRVRHTREDPRQPSGLAVVPDWMWLDGVPVTPEFAAALHLRLVAAATSAWPAGIAAAREYRAAHGHLDVLNRHLTASGFPLGRWVSDQRKRRQAGVMPAAQAAELEALGITWRPFDTRFTRGLEAARAWHAEHGHLDVPQSSAGAGGFPLGRWLSNARQARKAGRLAPDRDAALAAVDPAWHRDQRAETLWEAGVGACREYAAEHGTLNVPKGHVTAGGFPLGQWIGQRRKEHAGGEMSPARAAALEALGIAWSRHERRWQDGLDAFRAWTAVHGTQPVPAGVLTADGARLRAWVQNRRSEYRAGTLSPARAAALDAAGMVWDPHVQDWRDGLADCQDFAAAHGHLDIPHAARGDRIQALGKWVGLRRSERRAGTLAPDRAAALEALGIAWEAGRRRPPDGAGGTVTVTEDDLPEAKAAR